MSLNLLSSDTWRDFFAQRGLKSGAFAEQLCRIGLAENTGDAVLPRRAADELGIVLAAHSMRADVRLLVYDGTAAQPSATPNLRTPAKNHSRSTYSTNRRRGEGGA